LIDFLAPACDAKMSRLRPGPILLTMIARTLHCSCGWIVEQEPFDRKGKFLEVIKNIHLRAFPSHKCEIKEW
jgi:hypothetical protein